MSDTVVPVAWIAVRDALELRKHGRQEAVLYSESVGIDIALYEHSAIYALQSRIAELELSLQRVRGSCGKLAALIRDCDRFIQDPSDKYGALARENLLKRIQEATK